uniref:ER membrane protein complex subunit 1 n=1 Tax=Corethrella appendiculata TaxID=1370023 RepID=U5ER11_9DIPT
MKFNCKFNLNYLILLLFSLFNLSFCLYEDQVGKFDWRQHYVGRIKFAHFDPNSLDRIIVATESNVLAAISAKSGEILWRQILEKNPRGNIKLLQIPELLKENLPVQVQQREKNRIYDIITVSGHNPALIRGWNSNSGNLEWEWSLMPNSVEKSENSLWFIDEQSLFHVLPVWNSHIEITEYHKSSGQIYGSGSKKITAAWINADKCKLIAPYFVCVNGDQVIAINLQLDKDNVVTKSLSNLDTSLRKQVEIVNGDDSAILYGNKLISLNAEQQFVVEKNEFVFIDGEISNNKIVIFAAIDRATSTLKVTSKYLHTGEVFFDINLTANYPDTLGDPEIKSIICKQTTRNGVSQPTCRLLISSEDGAIVMLQTGKIKWIREEALADIVAVDFLDLTLSDAEGAIEEELNNKNGDIYSALTRRLSSQIGQLKNLVLHVFGLGTPPSKAQKAGLVRDDFGLHKMIIIVTKTGKIFGIDNVSGKQHWTKYLTDFTGFNNDQNLKLLVQRTSKFYPLSAQCVILGRNKRTQNGIIYQFNPITGQPIGGNGVTEFSFKFKQISLLHESGVDYLRGLLLLDEQDNVHVLPKTSEKYAHSLYLFNADVQTSIINGYYVEFINNELKTTPIWKLDLAGASGENKITAIELKNPIEHVHSQGRVLADRSVLYKYINPNLIAVATQGPDNVHKYILNVHLIDIVSGAIVFSMSHKRIRGPLHMVHSENWLVYTYYNEKVRRTELTSIELYEGKTQANSTVWSSLDTPPLPLVERQSYILPVSIEAMEETITEKGITNKHILLGLTTGAVIEMSWILLDPRRPVTSPEKAREEGIIPYMPELPLPHENIINYNQSVARINGIHTSPSGLESTCLLIVYGLDIFVTRVAPSKTFDLLKEDFDYFLISVVLIGLTTASYVTKHLASRKAVKQAWK